MKPVAKMSQAELAAYVQSHLAQRDIKVILSGGAAAAYYSDGAYVSADIDLVAEWQSQVAKEKAAMRELGFRKTNRYFEHPDTRYTVEILPGPPSLGKQPVRSLEEISLATGTLRILNATDSVKDRLAWYFYSGDTQALETALAIATRQALDFADLKAWVKAEGMQAEYKDFAERL